MNNNDNNNNERIIMIYLKLYTNFQCILYRGVVRTGVKNGLKESIHKYAHSKISNDIPVSVLSRGV